MILSEHVLHLLEMQHVDVKSFLHELDFLVHQAEIQIDVADLRVVVSSAHLQNTQRTVHVLEALLVVTAVVIVHCQCRVVEGDVRVVEA